MEVTPRPGGGGEVSIEMTTSTGVAFLGLDLSTQQVRERMMSFVVSHLYGFSDGNDSDV